MTLQCLAWSLLDLKIVTIVSLYSPRSIYDLDSWIRTYADSSKCLAVLREKLLYCVDIGSCLDVDMIYWVQYGSENRTANESTDP